MEEMISVSRNESLEAGRCLCQLQRLELFVRTEFSFYKILSSPPNGGTVEEFLISRRELTHLSRKSSTSYVVTFLN